MVPSRGGSRSIANHKFAMVTFDLIRINLCIKNHTCSYVIFFQTNKETQLPPYPIELYHKLHFKTKWLTEASRIEYVRKIFIFTNIVFQL